MVLDPHNREPLRIGSGLDLDSETTDRLGAAVSQILYRHRSTISDRPVGKAATAEELAAGLGELNEDGCPFEQVLDELSDFVLPNIVQQDHPRYFASIPSPGNAVAAYADAIAAGANIFGGNWAEGSGAAAIELACVRWLCRLCGLGEEAGGLFMSGGTMATLTALVAAREERLGELDHRAVLYTSTEGHFSIERAAMVLGMRPSQIRKVPVDDRQQIEVPLLAEAIAEDRDAGLRPLAVVATAGSTSTAVVDPLEALGSLCREQEVWLHVDAAYGGPSLLTEEGRELLAGIEQSDSITIDPHKWLFQPFGLGCLLVRDPGILRRTFRLVPAYLEELTGAGDIDFYDYGIEVSRPFRALRLWLSLRVFGIGAFRDAIEHGFELAGAAAAEIAEDPRLELVTGPQLGVVCFAYVNPELEEEACGRICDLATQALSAEGWAIVGCTSVGGRRVMRMCTMNPRTTEDEVRETVLLLSRHCERLALAEKSQTAAEDPPYDHRTTQRSDLD
jgi:aromatic-L-amino-acid/L-tryptophan decarboxylase